ncbi:membrane protein [Dietzia sp. UCD-THP]|nr:membrane protein [Dietzia sp. UCD-THP]
MRFTMTDSTDVTDVTDPNDVTDSGHTGGVREFVSHSAGAVVLVCGLFFLLSFMYLGGTADPQAHARHIPVAVVDSDAGASLDTPVGVRDLDVGSQITAGLLQNNDWERIRLHVVDPETAEEGLRNGSYFGAVRIPADLSERVVGLVEAAATEAGDAAEPPAPARVTVEYSPRVSIVSSQVMNTMAEAMQESFRDRMGPRLLADSQLLAEAEGRTIGAAATLALQDPVGIDVTAWNPLPEGVSNASLPMFYALIVVLAGFTGAMIISAVLDARLGFIPLEIGPLALHVHVAPFGRLQTLARKWAVTLVTAPLVSGLTLLVAHVIGVTGYDPWHLFWFSNLVIVAVGVCAHTIIAAIGNAGLLVNLVVFVVLGIPTSGGATPTQMLPQVFVVIGNLQPMHQAYLGIRSVMFFDSSWDAGLGHAVWVLGGWAVAGLLAGVVITLLYERMGMRRQAVAERVPAGRRSTGVVSPRGGVGVADAPPTGDRESGEVVERDPSHRE